MRFASLIHLHLWWMTTSRKKQKKNIFLLLNTRCINPDWIDRTEMRLWFDCIFTIQAKPFRKRVKEKLFERLCMCACVVAWDVYTVHYTHCISVIIILSVCFYRSSHAYIWRHLCFRFDKYRGNFSECAQTIGLNLDTVHSRFSVFISFLLKFNLTEVQELRIEKWKTLAKMS